MRMDKNHSTWKTASTILSPYKLVLFLLYEKVHVPRQDKHKVPSTASFQIDDNTVTLAITSTHPTKQQRKRRK